MYAFVAKLSEICFRWFPAAMLVPIWRDTSMASQYKSPTSFSGSLCSASLGRWKKDPGSADHVTTQKSGWQKNLLDRVGGRVFVC